MEAVKNASRSGLQIQPREARHEDKSRKQDIGSTAMD